MLLRVHRPQPALAAYVDYLWALRDVPAHAAERVLPSGTLELVINLAHDTFEIRTGAPAQALRFTGAMVSGAYERFFLIDTRDHADVLGVHFKPGGAWPLLGVAPGDLADRHSDLDALWSTSDVRILREQLVATPHEQRFDVLEAALLAHCEARALHPACAYAVRALESGERVAAVAEAVSLSPRRLQAVFQEHVGTTPKRYARLCRFQHALRALEPRPAPAWPSIAAAAGYCDQSHMIREFQAIAGCAPLELWRARRAPVKAHHVALRASDSSKT